MSKVIAVISGKGGAGKTATSVNLAWSLAKDFNYKVIIVDIDKDKPDALGWKEQGMAAGISKFDVDTLLCEDSPKEMISQLRNEYDFIIIDTPPNFQGEAFKATLASDFVIIPSSPSLSDQKALIKSMEIADECRKPYRLLAVRTQKRHNLSQELISSISELNGFRTNITLKSCVMEAQFHGLWVGEYQPEGDSHREFKNLAKEVIEYTN
ncbi:ParA family protein [Okeania sp.]|uniref:ParA family protein n=1 Tax=Okeania sp. TaxID=3100323 RepID=UPI002B4B93B4|nr:ParA family protein [Okeania sp.]MEB3343000.1 ParA family protein [Okeania sp.]